MRDVVVLYRVGVAGRAEDAAELAAIRDAGLRVFGQRADLQALPESLVVPRYSLWPHVRETLVDVERLGCEPINDRRASDFVRDLGHWSAALGGLTPRTTSWDGYVRQQPPGPVVLKGAEKSRKDRWGTHMFAADRAAAVQAYLRLTDDSLVGREVYVREYVPLEQLAGRDGAPLADLGGAPVTREFRFFVLDGRVACGGFYWCNHVEELAEVPDPSEVPDALLSEAVRRVRHAMPSLRFYTVDVARAADGRWLVVELNDGCQAGLSGVPAPALYGALAEHLRAAPAKTG
jgi:hypothetical protein